MPEAPLPTFITIGAQKSATRWLRINLGDHPEIYTAPSEVHFWNNVNRVRNHGLDWYRDQFRGASGERIIGEATPGYMIWRHHPGKVARRIHEQLPDVRLLAILRNPIDRASSALVHHIRRGRLPVQSRLIDIVRERDSATDRLCLVTGGWYAASLRPYTKRFGGRLLVLLHDDVLDSPETVYAAALAHVGASPDYRPGELNKIRFSNRAEPSTSRYELSPEERFEIWEHFAADVAELETLIGRDLSRWNPGCATESS